jgi:branched-chain amino acid transport system substrate-binding protein
VGFELGDLPRRDFLRLGAQAAGALALASCGGGGPTPRPRASGPDLKVGGILPASGMYAELGDSIRKGMQLYFDRVGNLAGGRRIVTIWEDELAGDTSIALSRARKLVEQDHVGLIAGIVAGPSAVAIRDYVDQNRIPTLIAHAGANSLSRDRRSPYVYRTSFSDWQLSQPMGKHLVDIGVKRLVLVYSNYPAGLETAQGIKETYSGEVLAEIRPPFPNSGGDFAATITQIDNARPDAIYVFMAGQDAVAFVKQARTQLDQGIRLTGTGFFLEQDVLGGLGDAAPLGALTGLHWALTLDNRDNQDFTSGFKRAFDRTADVYAMQGYDTARVIVEALNAVGGGTDDRLAFMKAISQVRFKSPRGDFRFDPNSNNVVNPVYVRQLVGDPRLGVTNRVVGTIPNVIDPGP